MSEEWAAELRQGRLDRAWDLFIGRYRRLIIGTIRRHTRDPDEVMDAFARVCEAFREDDGARLRRCADRLDPARPLSTLLVVVVRNLTIDWFRHRAGRPRLAAMASELPPRQRRIFEYVFFDSRSHVEAYELLRSRDGDDLSFPEFLREVRATYHEVTRRGRGQVATELTPFPAGDPVDPAPDPGVLAERRRILAAALETLAPDDRLAVQLYVVDGVPAAEVARALGFPGAKTVYNRVYRALAAIRERLEAAGIRAGDL